MNDSFYSTMFGIAYIKRYYFFGVGGFDKSTRKIYILYHDEKDTTSDPEEKYFVRNYILFA